MPVIWPTTECRVTDEVPRLPARLAPLTLATPPLAAVEYMELVDGTFVRWYVSEVDGRAVPGTRGSHCLLFACDGIIRRVWEYPPNWRTLDAAALTLLSWQR